jgi:hypothetical protein
LLMEAPHWLFFVGAHLAKKAFPHLARVSS